MNKKVIFIGGTSRSGSTLLDVYLANDSKAMSLGEIHALFHPTRVHHFEEIEKLRQNNTWNRILKEGKKNLFRNLIKEFPNVEIFVDSSKDPFWINYIQKIIKNTCEVYNILIFKSPEELAQSYIKRGQPNIWVKAYINYHRKYFTLINDFYSIAYSDFILDEKTKKELCNYLNISYSKEKSNYWEKSHNTFFGSNTVKSEEGYSANNQIKTFNRKTIEYKQPDDEIINKVKQVKQKVKQIYKIESFLNYKSAYHFKMPMNKLFHKLELNPITVVFLKLKYKMIYTYKYHFSDNYFNINKSK